jgi:antitoxin YefM
VNNAAAFTEVRDKLREILDDVVATGDTYTITRHGRPMAVIVSADEYESLIETLNILSDSNAMAAIEEGESDLGS